MGCASKLRGATVSQPWSKTRVSQCVCQSVWQFQCARCLRRLWRVCSEDTVCVCVRSAVDKCVMLLQGGVLPVWVFVPIRVRSKIVFVELCSLRAEGEGSGVDGNRAEVFMKTSIQSETASEFAACCVAIANCEYLSLKLHRASGECLGATRRRRTCQATICRREPQAGLDLRVSEWGNPAGVMIRHSCKER